MGLGVVPLLVADGVNELLNEVLNSQVKISARHMDILCIIM